MLFVYKAKNLKGEEVNGQKEAADKTDLAHLLMKEGLFLISTESLETDKTYLKSNKKNIFKNILILKDKFLSVPLSEKMLFARYLSLMVSAGISLNDSLRILAEQTQNFTFKKILFDLQNEIQKGNMLSKGLEKYPNVFSELFINMVRMGEVSGNLDAILASLAEQLKKENDLKSKIQGALVYPLVIILAMFGVGIFMMVKVVPTLTAIFKDMNINLPASTQFLIFISDNLVKNLKFFVIGFIVLIIGGSLFFKSKSNRHIFDSLILDLPLIGGIAKKINLARFSRTFGILLSSSLPIVDAIIITSNTLTNNNYLNVLRKAAEAVKKGEKLNETIKLYPKIFPLVITQMIKVGEETGALDEVLKKMADYYEEEIDVISKSLSSIIEPILMVIIGIVVGYFAIAMIQPIYSLMAGF